MSVAICSLQAQTSIAAAYAAQGRSLAPDSTASAPPAPPATLEDALHQACLSADIVFTGEITSISREQDAVVVRWHVEQAVKGIGAGTTYTQREWAGLWSGDSERYIVGQRALVLLHAPSLAGFSTPVQDGVVPLHGSAASSTVDLRWIAQHVAVSDAPRLTPMLALKASHDSFTAAAALLESAARSADRARIPLLTAPEQPVVSGPSTPLSQTSTDPNARVDSGMVLGMMHAWQRTPGTAQ